jgi:hypothetical protein
MTEEKQNILENICYTELVYDRINKKLHTDLSKKQIEAYLYKVLTDTEERYFAKTGKNYYVTNTDHSIRVTINSYTFRVITVDKIRYHTRHNTINP